MARRLCLELLEDRRLLTSLSGYVYNDLNNDGVMQASEAGIRNAKVTLTGSDDIHGDVHTTALTNSDGAYSFSLGSGTYKLTVGDPSGYVGGAASVGSQESGFEGNDTDSSGDNLFIDEITLDTGVNGVDNNFGELTAATVAGAIWDDSANNDGVKQTGEPVIAGLMVHLSGMDDRANDVELNTTTDSKGAYSFVELRPGSYTLTHDQPLDYVPGKVVAGSETNVVAIQPTLQGGEGQINLSVDPGENGANNNFAELRSASLAGYVWDDSANNDGVKQAGESGIQLVKVTLTGTSDLGPIASVSVFTAADGSYSISNLRPGTYALTEDQPSNYLDGKDAIGTPGGTAGNDQFTNIALTAGTHGANNNFGELRPASLSGFVWDDTANNDGLKQAGEPGISGATVRLTGTDDRGNAVSQTATTDAAGAYSFSNLRPGTYTLNEDQPGGFADGKDTIGTPGGTAGNDQFANIVLAAGAVGVNNNFGEKFPAVAYTLILKTSGRSCRASRQPGQVSPQTGRFVHDRGPRQRRASRRRGQRRRPVGLRRPDLQSQSPHLDGGLPANRPLVRSFYGRQHRCDAPADQRSRRRVRSCQEWLAISRRRHAAVAVYGGCTGCRDRVARQHRDAGPRSGRRDRAQYDGVWESARRSPRPIRASACWSARYGGIRPTNGTSMATAPPMRPTSRR